MVALDGSKSSQRALDETAHIAKCSNARVHIVFVADAAALSSYPARYRSEVFGHARRMLDDAQAHLHAAGTECETQLLETQSHADPVARCLQRCAVERSADLVVMGTHGRAGFRRLVLGSVAEAFLRNSTCPVLMIRSRPQA
ncbi:MULTISPECIES: universal stress protein [unclassified Caballeronia]|uniref:universal stress protein n=1 Tax=unclassified Caballeronia TaxID=2646786 RepID=UPI00285851CA|nr:MULTISPECIES: universal stress protein [unclassified Caballeronia]MDR5777498.1 universal stress protein [Caballeronia sp. LZ002]MDR5798559.1 universal stress protein [Caballeronia sp. LZ001]MDR5852916.1 universal stress protein [Caballeronia sp. LZ003]